MPVLEDESCETAVTIFRSIDMWRNKKTLLPVNSPATRPINPGACSSIAIVNPANWKHVAIAAAFAASSNLPPACSALFVNDVSEETAPTRLAHTRANEYPECPRTDLAM